MCVACFRASCFDASRFRIFPGMLVVCNFSLVEETIICPNIVFLSLMFRERPTKWHPCKFFSEIIDFGRTNCTTVDDDIQTCRCIRFTHPYNTYALLFDGYSKFVWPSPLCEALAFIRTKFWLVPFCIRDSVMPSPMASGMAKRTVILHLKI